MSKITKEELLERGQERVSDFCRVNDLVTPEFKVYQPNDWRVSACAYYRPTYIAICPHECAWPGYAGRAWSWPGYVIDRTPFGVMCHELGHHVDVTVSGVKSGYQGSYSQDLRAKTGEVKLTNYCPNDAEWFAEIFRLFVTNPNLLSHVRPATHAMLSKTFDSVERRGWHAVLTGAPARTISMARRKMVV